MKFGKIGMCAQCHNKAEVHKYPNDNPDPICEDCYKENQQLEKKIQSKAEQVQSAQVTLDVSTSYGSDERQQYLDVIWREATDEWLENLINEVLTKKVMYYDWKKIIMNERWFSILDLRRFALELCPDMDKPKDIPKGFSMLVEEPVQKIKRIYRKRNLKKEPINA